ncbi:glycoside hydrolase family 2 protein [Bifidobacterium avesanii]|uniref:Beta-galactosidase n=1 Tax=Bifidobacterium avesanii TaxID=1798157 RepID=A0A7K3TIV4_9BIFI|nr:glycoside hydrolase family 2 TIM barrel-domain containing protein [Bifidobacterium avesanii]KAB8292642.1 beta-galactosidase [Bifidobacterium avesanii]NEG78530.1 beta-galactosidase [Bifidobacterium avesanii]
MRTIIPLTDGWLFTKAEQDGVPAYAPGADWTAVTVPHTWNKFDGQDGGSDYYRGACWYVRKFDLGEQPEGALTYVQFHGAANVAEAYVNGVKVAEHKGGFSTFRADITSTLIPGENVLAVKVSNEERSDVYPQMADFTFYGGLYRPVELVTVPAAHFDLDYFAGPGVTVSSKPHLGPDSDGHATIDARAYVTGAEEGDFVNFQVTDEMGVEVAGASAVAGPDVRVAIDLPDAHLWQGVEDPYLYTVTATLMRHNEVLDEVEVHHGVREFRMDPQQGFFLNGRLTPLRGVSRHQDRLGKGNALSLEDHIEDAYMIKELGANTVRLAHYQQAQEFYDLCDMLGLVVWAEIPFISRMNEDPAAHEDCRQQMTELIVQSFNHPSIVTWGISNEILIGGDSEQLVANLKDLNELCHKLDPTRVTTMAQVSNTPKDSEHNQITDILSYNHYFGWYGGKLEDNEEWLDEFHAMHPDRATGISEYGCEGIISYHSDNPQCGDYSEEYQAIYHEHMARIIEERPWLWATHVWNMFDFGCDSRDEGGVKGRNNKGLVTIDRKIKKDSFYVYQAYWSHEPMIHIASKRYALRAADRIAVKVYSNADSVELLVDGEPFASLTAHRVFEFKDVPLKDGATVIEAHATGSDGTALSDTATFTKVAEPYAPYTFVDPDGGAGVANWFDDVNLDTVKEDAPIDPSKYSVKDIINDVLENKEASRILANVASGLSGMRLKASMFGMMGTSTVEELFGKMGGMSGKPIDEEELKKKMAYANAELQKIAK